MPQPYLSPPSLFINNPLCSVLAGNAWQAAGFAGEQCGHLFMTPLMLLPINTITDCLTLESRDSDLYIDTKHDLTNFRRK